MSYRYAASSGRSFKGALLRLHVEGRNEQRCRFLYKTPDPLAFSVPHSPLHFVYTKISMERALLNMVVEGKNRQFFTMRHLRSGLGLRRGLSSCAASIGCRFLPLGTSWLILYEAGLTFRSSKSLLYTERELKRRLPPLRQ